MAGDELDSPSLKQMSTKAQASHSRSLEVEAEADGPGYPWILGY